MSIAMDFRCAPGSRLRAAHGAFGVERLSLSPAGTSCALPPLVSGAAPKHGTASAKPPTLTTLTLRTSNLTDMEITKIDAFLRVGRHRLLGDWRVVLDGPCHVLMLGGPRQDSEFADDWDALTILRVHDGHAPQGTNALVRPLQYDAFVDALAALERNFPVRPPTALTDHRRIATPMPPAPVPAHRKLPYGSQARFRLQRWPSAAILGAHRYNIRLASFMSGRHVSLNELIRLSNVDDSQCEQFLFALDDAAILDVKVAETAPAPRPLPTVDGEGSSHHSGVERGLLERIRRRLGLKGAP